MKNERAYQYYFRLLDLGIKQDLLMSLTNVADKLCTTPRHARTILQSLQQLEWLSWTPKVGRSQRSVLHLHYSQLDLQYLLAKELISDGKYNKALDLLAGDQQKFAMLLQQTSGAILREGQLHIQLTYHRTFDRLLPHKPLRNSERFLVRQIYACLVTCDQKGNLQPQLAHHWWSNDDATEWHFYIRPQLHFHSNTLIDAPLICDLFTRLKALPEYSKEMAHLISVSASHQCVQFKLSSPDLSFAALLSDLRYSIQPPSQVASSKTLPIDGSGPFQVVEQTDQRLQLQAFERYFSLRSLTDTVTIWQFEHTPCVRIQFDQADNDRASSKKPDSNADENREDAHIKTRIENGCIYLLFNMNTAQSPLSHSQRKYLSKLLSPELILQEEQLPELLLEAVPAFNLLSDWAQVRPQSVEPTELPKPLDIAVYDYQVVVECANALSKKLNQMGIASKVNIYSYVEMYQRAEQHTLPEALIIGSLYADDNLPISVYRWFCSDTILQHGLSVDAKEWVSQEVLAIRQTTEVSNYLHHLESIANTMNYENWITPLFHHKQTLRWQGVLKDVSITDWSWPDLKNVWVDR